MNSLNKLLPLAFLLTFSTATAQNKENKKNGSSFPELVSYLYEEGFRIDSLLNNPKFKIYDNICGVFKKNPETQINNLEEYKKAIDYENKKQKIPGFINNNLEKLLEAEKKYGIPKEIIASIIGIESDFGDKTGKYNPFNAYISMYMNGCKKEFAKKQLRELLIFCKKNDLDIFLIKSSYAGAISYGQFLPSSLNTWFIGNDLCSMENNILSVANYLNSFKKLTGSMEKAVYNYNRSNIYVKAVLALARDAEKMLGKKE